MELISVIVPVYNVEHYLDRCIESIVNQTYKNLEIILVDDGSLDKSSKMCDIWAKKDSRIKVIHKENGGLSDARNAGMTIANGELIGFVDSDDWIGPNMYELLYDHLKKDESDIAACGVKMVYEDNFHSKMLTKPGNCILNTEEAMQAIIEESWLKQPVWYKLYKTEMIRNILFPIGKCHEDVFWSWQAVAKARRVSVFDQPCYFYWQRNSSIMGKGYSLRRLDALEAKLQRLSYVKDQFSTLVNDAKFDLWFFSMYTLQMCMQYLSDDELTIARKRVSEIINAVKPIQGKDRMPITYRIWMVLSKISFEGTCQVRNLLKIGI